MGGDRTWMYRAECDRALEQAGLTGRRLSDDEKKRDGQIRHRAKRRVDRWLDKVEREYSAMVWTSPLAPNAQGLIDVLQHRGTELPLPGPMFYVEQYEWARSQLFEQRLAERGLDYCRKCKSLTKVGQVKVALIYEAHVRRYRMPGSDEYVVEHGFWYACRRCRRARPRRTAVMRSGGKNCEVETFREVYRTCVQAEGWWALVGSDYVQSAPNAIGWDAQPSLDGTAPLSCPWEMCGQMHVPPKLMPPSDDKYWLAWPEMQAERFTLRLLTRQECGVEEE